MVKKFTRLLWNVDGESCSQKTAIISHPEPLLPTPHLHTLQSVKYILITWFQLHPSDLFSYGFLTTILYNTSYDDSCILFKWVRFCWEQRQSLRLLHAPLLGFFFCLTVAHCYKRAFKRGTAVNNVRLRSFSCITLQFWSPGKCSCHSEATCTHVKQSNEQKWA